MKIGKQNKKNNNAPRGEFASIFNESPWERFTDRIKPLIKVLVVLAVIGGVGYGGFLLFGNKNHSASNAATDSAANTQADAQKQLAQCLAGVRSSNPVPEAGDADFYKKLIGGYDQQLGCYDKYPDVDSTGRTSIEGLKTSALDASGSFKYTYIANGSSGSGSQSLSYTDPTTGCVIGSATTESDYIKCTDAYNAAHHTSVSSAPPTQYTAPQATTSPTSSSTTTPSNNTTSPTTTSSTNYTELNKCLDDANSKYTTEASRARARQGCYETWGL